MNRSWYWLRLGDAEKAKLSAMPGGSWRQRLARGLCSRGHHAWRASIVETYALGQRVPRQRRCRRCGMEQDNPVVGTGWR